MHLNQGGDVRILRIVNILIAQVIDNKVLITKYLSFTITKISLI